MWTLVGPVPRPGPVAHTCGPVCLQHGPTWGWSPTRCEVQRVWGKGFSAAAQAALGEENTELEGRQGGQL